MPLSKKSLQDLEKLLGEASNEQLLAIKSDLDAQLMPKMMLADLLEARDAISAVIMSAQAAQKDKFRSDAKAKFDELRAVAQQLGLDLAAELGIAPAAKVYKSAGTNGGSGKTVAVKFRNPRNHNETWSTRGRRPNWLIRELASKGMNETAPIPDEYKIENQQ